MIRFTKHHLTTYAVWAFGLAPLSAHDHFFAGVTVAGNSATVGGEKLRIYGPDFSNKIFHLLPRPKGFRPIQRCGGYYMLDENPRTLFPNDGFSFAAYSDGTEEPAPLGHAHTGAWIWMEIVAVTGPPGAGFGFWDVLRGDDHDTPTVSFPVNQPTGNFAFQISLTDDSAGADPFGHFHERSWTADKPGDYQVAFRLVDRSTNRAGGVPWHPPSDIYTFHFKAGPDFQPQVKQIDTNGLVLEWPSQMGIWSPYQTGIVFRVLRGDSLSGNGWTHIGSVTGTTAATLTFTDPSPPAGKAFYRLAYDWGNNDEAASGQN